METAVDCFQQGVEYQERGLFDLAIEEYIRALEADPENIDVLVNLGAAYLQKGLAERSTHVLNKALAAQPNHPLALYNLGKAYLYRDESAKALDIFQRAAAVMPDDPEVKKSIAQSLLHLGRKDEACGYFRALLLELSSDVQMHLLYGKTLSELERHTEALDVYRKSVNLAPDSGEALEGMLRSQLALDLKDKALTTLKRAMMVDPKNPVFHTTLVDLLIDEGKVDEAIAHLKKALSSDPAQPVLRKKMEELTRRLPVLKKRAGIDLVEKSSPFEMEVYDLLDGLYDGRITLEAAIHSMKSLHAKDPADLFIADELANLFFQARLYEDAIELYNQINKSAPEVPRHRINLAKSLAMGGNLQLAREFLEESIRDIPQDVELPLALVELSIIERTYQKAWPLLEKTLNSYPDNSHGLFLYGFISLRLGALDRARESFQKVMKLAPDDEEVAVWYSRLMILLGTPQLAIESWKSFQDGIESLQEVLTRVELALAAGDVSSARDMISKVGEYEPHFLEDEVLFGKAYFYAGDFTSAGEHLNRVIAKDPNHSEALALLAMTQLVKNKSARFWMLWQKAIESDSLFPVLTGLILRHVLNFTQIERLRSETRKLVDLSIKDDIDRARLIAFLKML
ncbi:MAG: tetratricopeptide repeat protein [Candidatus Riflebacteria bacterium]|nr:tetratricopeptide repeat protein [Candidatus Riflebacteria bacterium]